MQSQKTCIVVENLTFAALKLIDIGYYLADSYRQTFDFSNICDYSAYLEY